MTQDLQELMDVGGGQTGVSKVPQPVAKTATLPNSKHQGDLAPKKLEGEVQDTDSENNTNATGDYSAKNKASVAMKEDIEGLFDGQDLTEEFKEKAVTIFEAAVHAKVESLREEMQKEFEAELEEQVVAVVEDISTKVDDYMNYVVKEWMVENEVAIESSLRSEITEEFIDGLKTLFQEHYIDVPEDKVSVVEELADKVEELESRLNESIEQNIELSKVLDEHAKDLIFAEVAEGLVAVQADKFKTLAEGVEFSDAETYKRKLEIVKENYFAGKVVKSNMIEEEVESADEPVSAAPRSSGPVAHYVSAISSTIKK